MNPRFARALAGAPLILGTATLLFVGPTADTCGVPPCVATGTVSVYLADSIGQQVPGPMTVESTLAMGNLSSGFCNPTVARVTGITATEIDTEFGDVSALSFVWSDGTPMQTPFDVQSQSYLSGKLVVDFGPGAPKGTRRVSVEVEGFDVNSGKEFFTQTTALVSLAGAILVSEPQQVGAYPPGTTAEFTFSIRNLTNVDRLVNWQIGSEQYTSSFDGYKKDDGTSEAAEGIVGVGGGGTMAWLQGFRARPGGAAITSIDIAFGTPKSPASNPPNGGEIMVAVWDDPDDDGVPDDAVLVAVEQTTVMNSGTDIFNRVGLSTPVRVQGHYFLGCWLQHAPGVRPAPRDASRLSLGSAWMTGAAQGAIFNPGQLANNSVPLTELDASAKSGIWMIRGNMEGAVDHFPLALGGQPVPKGDPQSAVKPATAGSLTVPANGVSEVKIATRSYKGCHAGSACRYGLTVTDVLSTEESHLSTTYVALPPTGWTGITVQPGICEITPYCTAKANSAGCFPTVYAGGTPSASLVDGFCVAAGFVVNKKAGILLYSVTGPDAVPFQNGTLCLKGPIKRTVGLWSGGDPAGTNCSGTFLIDMNAFAAGTIGGNPLPGLHTMGQEVFCQFWGRDPGWAPPNNTQLSDGLRYRVCP